MNTNIENLQETNKLQSKNRYNYPSCQSEMFNNAQLGYMGLLSLRS